MMFLKTNKFHVIEPLDSGESAKKIVSEVGVGTSTTSDYKRSFIYLCLSAI